jgi:hypothetical protein
MDTTAAEARIVALTVAAFGGRSAGSGAVVGGTASVPPPPYSEVSPYRSGT